MKATVIQKNRALAWPRAAHCTVHTSLLWLSCSVRGCVIVGLQ